MKLYPLFLLLMVSVLTLSCRKDSNKQPDSLPVSMDELKVANSFNWKTTSDYHFSLKSGNNGIVEIISEEGVVFHRANLTAGQEYKAKIAIPTYIKSLAVNHHGLKVVVDLNSELINLTF